MANLMIDPDYYTKVLLDQNGNIIGVGQLDELDLPEHKHNWDEIEGDFKKKVIESLSQFFVNNANSAVVFDFDKQTGTVTADLRYDGVTIFKNEDGELESAGGGGEGGSGPSLECATHTHVVKDITDFEEAVKKLLKENQTAFSVEDFRDIIDNVTVIINESGKLSAVGSGVTRHTHKMADIEDYVPCQPAALQPMSDLGPDADYKNGPIDMTNLSVGYAILSLNYYQSVILRKLEALANQISRIALTSSNANALSVFAPSNSSVHRQMYDKESKVIRDVYYAKGTKLKLEALPYDDCKLTLLVNGSPYAVCDTALINYVGATAGPDGIIQVVDVVKKGEAGDLILNFDLRFFKDGVYDFQLMYDLGDGVVDYSESIRLALTDKKEMVFNSIDNNPTHTIDGNIFYDKPFSGQWICQCADFDKYRFVADKSFDKNGNIYVAAKDPYTYKDSIAVDNLFGTSIVGISFPYREEASESELFGLLVNKDLKVINDKLTLKGSERAWFEFPNSNWYNAIQIIGLPGTAVIEMSKGKTIASSKTPAERPNTPGYITSDLPGTVLSLLGAYDDGKSNVSISISCIEPIDLKKVQYKLLNLSF